MILALVVFAQVGSVQFQARTYPDTVYVGQQVTYDGVTFVDDVARMRLRANPEYTPPDVEGVTIYDFPFDTAAIETVRASNGVTYRRYTYRRAMFPLTPGVYQVPAAMLKYELPDRDSYYSTRNTYTATSPPSTFVALPLPATGRPLDFTGAVGQFADSAFTNGALPRVGDSFTFTVRVFGVGNITMLPRPTVAIDWADVVEGEERVTWDSVGTVVRGAKEFDWVVTPRVSGALFVPPVRYDYFDPAAGRYAVATTHAVSLTVTPGPEAQAPVTLGPSERARDDTPLPAIVRFVRANPLLVWGVAAAVAFLVIFLAIRARTRPSDDGVDD